MKIRRKLWNTIWKKNTDLDIDLNWRIIPLRKKDVNKENQTEEKKQDYQHSILVKSKKFRNCLAKEQYKEDNKIFRFVKIMETSTSSWKKENVLENENFEEIKDNNEQQNAESIPDNQIIIDTLN